jgi:hypothetical protein
MKITDIATDLKIIQLQILEGHAPFNDGIIDHLNKLFLFDPPFRPRLPDERKRIYYLEFFEFFISYLERNESESININFPVIVEMVMALINTPMYKNSGDWCVPCWHNRHKRLNEINTNIL